MPRCRSDLESWSRTSSENCRWVPLNDEANDGVVGLEHIDGRWFQRTVHCFQDATLKVARSVSCTHFKASIRDYHLVERHVDVVLTEFFV